MQQFPLTFSGISIMMLITFSCAAQQPATRLPADFDNLVFEDSEVGIENIHFEKDKGYYEYTVNKRQIAPPAKDTLSRLPDGTWKGRFVTVVPGESDLAVTYKDGSEKGKTKRFRQITGKRLAFYERVVNINLLNSYITEENWPAYKERFDKLTKEQQLETGKGWTYLDKQSRKLTRREFQHALDSFLVKYNLK